MWERGPFCWGYRMDQNSQQLIQDEDEYLEDEDFENEAFDEDGFEDEDFADEDFEDEYLEDEYSEGEDSEDENSEDDYSEDEVPVVTASEEQNSPEDPGDNRLREWRPRMRRQLRRRQRHLAVLLVLSILFLVGIVLFRRAVMSDGWHDTEAGRIYRQDGKRAIGQRMIDGVLYLFDGDGYLIEGPAEDSGDVYYSTASGIRKGVATIDGEDYLFDETDGKLKRGFYTENGVLYFRNSHGFIEPGIREIDGHVYQIASDGRVLSGWLECEAGSRYFAPEDNVMQTGMCEIDGKQYAFDWNGYLLKGFVKTANSLYYASEETGALSFGRITVDGKEYYFSEDGARLNGAVEIDGQHWYLADNVFHYGWIEDSTGTFYSTETGGLVVGSQKIDGRNYYFEEDYRLARGWVSRSGNRFYYDTDGAMLTGWQTIDGVRYCFSDSGVLRTGEVEIDGTKYRFREDGAYFDGYVTTEFGEQYYKRGYLQTGITKIGDKYYYLDSNGVVSGGRHTVDGKAAFYNEDGSAMTGWQKIDGKKYYLGSDGVMKQGITEIGGKYYYLAKEGGLLSEGWHSVGGKIYCYSDGTIATGVTKIDGKLYAFSDSGTLITKEGLQRVDGKTRYVNSDGTIVTNKEMTISGQKYTIDSKGVATKKFSSVNEDNIEEYLKYVIENEIKSKDIKSLYNWVKRKIGYYSYYSSGSKSTKTLAVEALNKRCGACWHYAALMTMILKAAGYDARVLKGGGHTFAEHQWTIVKKDGVWYHIDAMRSSVYMVTTEKLKEYKFTYQDSRYGPRKGEKGYTAEYYYGYTMP